MKLPEKESERPNHGHETVSGVFLGARTISLITAISCIFLFFSFFTGYFLGQKRAIARFTHKLDQDSFADQIYAALCSLDESRELAQTDDTTTTDDDALQVSAATEEQRPAESPAVITAAHAQQDELTTDAAAPELTSDQVESADLENNTQEISTHYYAQLAGFGTAKAAQRWAHHLQKKGTPVFVKKRSSRSARGSLISWYQVVTERFQDKAKLEELVATIKKEEKISDVHLASC